MLVHQQALFCKQWRFSPDNLFVLPALSLAESCGLASVT